MNYSVKIACFGLLFFCTSNLDAQNFKYSIPGLDTLVTQFVIQGGASTVLNDNQTEFISNSTLLSYWIAAHVDGDNSPIIDRFRNTQFISDFYVFHGFSTVGRFDVGLQLRYMRSRLDNAASSSPLKVFEAEGDFSDVDIERDPSGKLDNSYGGMAYAGARFRLKPLLRRPEWVINAGYLLAILSDEQRQNAIGADRDILEIGTSYYRNISSNVLYFLNANMQIYMPGEAPNKLYINQDRDKALYNTQLGAYLIYRTNNKRWSIYPGLAYGVSFKTAELQDDTWVRTQDFLFAQGGVQYGANNRFNIFAAFAFPLQIDLANPLLEIVRESYSSYTLGFRFAML